MPENKVAAITGAAHRIGACIAATFHRHGFEVIVHYNQSEQAAHQLVAQLNAERPGTAAALQANLAEAGQVESLAQAVARLAGRASGDPLET